MANQASRVDSSLAFKSRGCESEVASSANQRLLLDVKETSRAVCIWYMVHTAKERKKNFGFLLIASYKQNKYWKIRSL